MQLARENNLITVRDGVVEKFPVCRPSSRIVHLIPFIARDVQIISPNPLSQVTVIGVMSQHDCAHKQVSTRNLAWRPMQTEGSSMPSSKPYSIRTILWNEPGRRVQGLQIVSRIGLRERLRRRDVVADRQIKLWRDRNVVLSSNFLLRCRSPGSDRT